MKVANYNSQVNNDYRFDRKSRSIINTCPNICRARGKYKAKKTSNEGGFFTQLSQT